MQRCAWVVEPANTWSNLAYLLVAALLWWAARRTRARSAHLRFFAPAALLVGAASGIYHASYTFVLQILDFFGMYVFCYLLLVVNLQRLGFVAARDWRRRFWQLVLGSTALTVAVDFLEVPIQALVLLLILALVGSELWLRLRSPGASLRFFALGVGLLCAGSAFSLLDVTRTWCQPTHPVLQGHAIWHVLSALSLGAAFAHYLQFDAALVSPSPRR
jgi:hypothetical protein